MLVMAPGTSNMLRARRKDINVKPNRRLDRKSSRGMLFENEELRLRTININAEVEKGQSDIKKLRKENEHLRREIWGLRDEYDRLESLLKKRSEEDSEDEDEEYDQDDGEDEDEEDHDNAQNQRKATTTTSAAAGRVDALRADFDGLSVVDEEAEGASVDADPPYCGTITLPDGRQGVFFSDAMAAPRRKVNGAGPSPEEYQAFLADHEGAVPYPCYEDPAPDYYAARGGPDLFVAGAYPDAMFPAGGNLDQLLKEMHCSQQDTVAIAGSSEEQAREVIDALESRLGDCSCVRGVRAQPGECFICVSRQQEVRQLLRAGLNLRGQQLALHDVSRDSVLVCLTGVPHHVDDSTVALLANNFGAVIGEVERMTYKGVDTGERLLRIKPHAASETIPPAIVLAGSKVEVKIVGDHDYPALEHTDMQLLEPLPEQQTGCSSDNSFGADNKFRSQLNVRLKLPNAPPFFQPLPTCRRAPPWPTIDSPQPQAPTSNPFAADYQATLPCGGRLHSPELSGNPFTFPQASAGYFDPEVPLAYGPPDDPAPPQRAPPAGDSPSEPAQRPAGSPAADKRPSKKASVVAAQHSEPTTPTGVLAGRKERPSRKMSTASQCVVDGEVNPSAASTPSARKKSAGRKASAGLVGDPPAADLSRCSSSSGQDSPTKSDRRRRVSIHFSKKSVCSRKDSVAVGNGTGHQRSVSLDHARTGDGTTTSERERTNSVSSKSSSAVSGVRRNLAAKDLELADHKVPWCGCWGNGCI